MRRNLNLHSTEPLSRCVPLSPKAQRLHLSLSLSLGLARTMRLQAHMLLSFVSGGLGTTSLVRAFVPTVVSSASAAVRLRSSSSSPPASSSTLLQASSSLSAAATPVGGASVPRHAIYSWGDASSPRRRSMARMAEAGGEGGGT